MANFLDALSTKKASETEKPKPKPTGTYMGAVSKLPEGRKVTTKNGEASVIEFSFKMIAPHSDVEGDTGDISGWPPLRKSYWPDTEEGEWAMKQFLEQVLGLELADKTYGELFAESVNRQCLCTLVHSPYVDKDGQPGIRTDIGAVAAI